MAFVDGLFRLLHVAGAMAWFGGLLLLNTRVIPAFTAAGPAAGPVQMALVRKGGWIPYFAPASIITVLTGLYLYYAGTWWEVQGIQGALLNLGVLAGVVALAIGIIVLTPVQKKLAAIVASVEGAPSPEQGQEMMALGAKGIKTSKILLYIVGIAVFGMAGRGLFA